MTAKYISHVDDFTFNPYPPTIPPAQIVSARLLLTEKSLVAVQEHPLAMVTETLTMRATRVTAILKEIPGYDHWGINE